MRIIQLLLLITIAFAAHGQKATRVWQTTGLTFPNGFHPFSTGEAVYFNAYHPEKGFQLFELKDQTVKQVTRFENTFGKKEDLEGLLGAQTDNYVWYYNQLYFFARGKGIASGIYMYNGWAVRKVLACDIITNDFAIHDDKLVTQIGQAQEEGTQYYHIEIDSYLKIKRAKDTLGVICSELESHKGKLYGVLFDQLYEINTNAGEVQYTQVEIKEHPTHISALTSTERGLCFKAFLDGSPYVAMLDDDVVKLHAVNAWYLGDELWKSPKGNIYFMAHQSDLTELIRWRKNNRMSTFSSAPQGASLTGMCLADNQLTMSFGVPGNCALYQVNGNRLLPQKFRYIQQPRNVISLNQNLVYLATENGHDYVYTSAPLLPPRVRDTSFVVFDFWPNGRRIGQIKATSLSRKGSLRYYVASGNPQSAFTIDELTGDLKVNNEKYLYTSGKEAYDLVVQVKEKRKGSSYAKVHLTVQHETKFDATDLRETLMFFPDFGRANTLNSRQVANGVPVYVYDVNFKMVDVITVENGRLVLGEYPAGLYILNVRNNENLYQKIELH